MRVEHLTVLLMELQDWPHISVAAVWQVGLEEQALDLAAFVLLLRLDLVEGELKGTGGSKPNWQSPSAKTDAKTGVIPISPV